MDGIAKVAGLKKKATTSKYTQEQFIRDVQRACGAKVDGIAGHETLSKTVTLSASKNRKHAAVKPVQERLYHLGYHEVGEADGIAGPKFTEAVKAFQKDNGCYVDGEITAKNKTWKKLLGMG
jgi:peptidoglycan hydrolase-like protein with peptidoglycan-binding domain